MKVHVEVVQPDTDRPDRLNGFSRIVMGAVPFVTSGVAAYFEGAADADVALRGRLPEAVDFYDHAGNLSEGGYIAAVGFVAANTLCDVYENVAHKQVGTIGRMVSAGLLVLGLSGFVNYAVETEKGIEQIGRHYYAESELHPDPYDAAWGIAGGTGVALSMVGLRRLLISYQKKQAIRRRKNQAQSAQL